LETKPLKRYADPNYPTRDILDDHPELLRQLPRRWRRHALLLAAVTAAGALAAGCRAQVAAVEAQPAGTPAPPPPAPSRVAPVFPHGDGHGFFGGKPAPTYFLTEEEARQVVVEEGKRAGIDFAADGLALPDIALPVTYRQDPGGPEQPADTRHGPLVLDGADAKRQIAYEYVSQGDFAAWEGKSEIHSTAWEENLQAAAKGLRDGLAAAKPAGAFGVFYDPIVKSLPEQEPGMPADLDERTLAPLSKFQGWEGWTAQFDEKTGVVTFTGKRTIVLKIGSAQATLDDRAVTLPAAPRMCYDSPYLPMQWTADALGGTVRGQGEHGVSLQAPEHSYKWTDQVQQVALSEEESVNIAFAWHDQNTRRAMALETARAELRAQVRDFIKWLKAEGVI